MQHKINPIDQQSETPLGLHAVIEWITHLHECINKPAELTRDFIQYATMSSSKIESWFADQLQGADYSWMDSNVKRRLYNDFAELKLVLSKAIEHYTVK